MNKTQIFTERRTFIEGYLFACLKSLDKFEAIRYAKAPSTDAEYIRITDYIGGKVYLDITAKTDAEVFIDVARIVLASVDENVSYPTSLIVDKDKRFAVSYLFRAGGNKNE